MASLTVKKTILFALLFISSALVTVGHAADKAPARKARVAGGAQVQLAPSSRAVQQWLAARPGSRDLRPKPRGTFD